MGATKSAFTINVGQWMGHEGLRAASHEERGVWVDLLCLMHAAEDRGILRDPLDVLAASVGATVETLESLVRKGVLAGRRWPASPGDPLNKFSQVPFVFTPMHSKRPGMPVTLIEDGEGEIWFCPEMVIEEYKRRRQVASSRRRANREDELSRKNGDNLVDNFAMLNPNS